MTSAINTSSLNSDYPTPGVNNSSQGFRDNFTNIKTNLDTISTELSDLQSKVLVKSGLTGTVMNNDMFNGVISNVQTLGFRASMYNLGTNLSGLVTVDCTLADVHYGIITGDITLSIDKWAPANTLGRVEVMFTVTAGQKINLPSSVTLGIDTIEGRSGLVITVPAGVSKLHYVFSSGDCGTTVEIMPVDRPRQTTQIKWGTPATSKGVMGDQQGMTMIDATYIYTCITTYVDGTANIWKRTAIGSGTW